MTKRETNTRLALATAALGLCVATGCQWLATQSSSARSDVERVDDATLENECARLRAANEQMQAKLDAHELDLAKRSVELESQLELKRLLAEELEATTLDLEYLEAQFVSLERGLTSTVSKASATAAMAEVRLVREKILKEQPGALTADVMEEVDGRLTAADDELTLGKYAAAAYHARRALRLLTHTQRRHGAFLASGTPRVVAVGMANLREGPSPDATVVSQLAYGTILVELHKREVWCLVRLRDGARGWVHASLIQ